MTGTLFLNHNFLGISAMVGLGKYCTGSCSQNGVYRVTKKRRENKKMEWGMSVKSNILYMKLRPFLNNFATKILVNMNLVNHCTSVDV